MSKTTKDQSKNSNPVGVVMRSEAPLIEELLSEKEQTSYSVSIVDSKSQRRRLMGFSLPLVISALSVLDAFKLTR